MVENIIYALLGNSSFVRFVIGKKFAIDNALAIAHHPYLIMESAIDNSTGSKSFFGMLLHIIQRDIVELIDVTNTSSDTFAKSLHCDVGTHRFNKTLDEQHTITPVLHIRRYVNGSFTSAAINNGNEVICDDDSVLARLLTLLAYDLAFYYFHFC